MRLSPVMSLAAVLLTAARLGAQQPTPPPSPEPPPKAPAPATVAAPAHPPTDAEGSFDPAAVERGRQLLVQQCGFCHGSNARGGQQGPDLTRSDLVQSDENGKQLGAFLKVGRPELKMPQFDLPEKDVADLAAFLHSDDPVGVEPRRVQDPRHRGRRPQGRRGLFQRRGQVQRLPLAHG